MFAGIDETRCDIRYQPTYEFCSVFSKNCTNYYSRIVDSMLHLFTLITTANYPDVMMPAYNCSQWNALFFILFLLIGLYFLMSLVLAVAYTHFQEQTKHKVVSLLRRRVAGLTLAFNVISQPKRRFLASAFPGAEPADHHNLVPPGAKTYRHVGPAGELAAEAGGGEGMPPPGAWRRRRSSSGAGRDPMSRSSRQKLLLHSSFRSYIVGAEGEERDDATVITWQQWLRLMKHVSPELQEDFLAVLFDIVDVDDDGQITLSEFQHLASLAEVRKEAARECFVIPPSCRRHGLSHTHTLVCLLRALCVCVCVCRWRWRTRSSVTRPSIRASGAWPDCAALGVVCDMSCSTFGRPSFGTFSLSPTRSSSFSWP